jgi:arsenate reductase
MESARVFHNPRQALELLMGRGIRPGIVRYLDTPTTAPELDIILQQRAPEPRQSMRRKEPERKRLTLDNADLRRRQLIATMIANPRLTERPIV